MAGRPTKKRTCAPPVSVRAMPENEKPPAMRVDTYCLVSLGVPPDSAGEDKRAERVMR